MDTDNSIIANLQTIEEVREAADRLGVKYSGNTGIEKLRENIAATLNMQEREAKVGALDLSTAPEVQAQPKVPNPRPAPTLAQLATMVTTKEMSVSERRLIVRAKALQLVRIKLANLDPNDQQLQGELVTVSSRYTGRVSKFIPFGSEPYENGYHVPKIIYDHLMSKKFVMRKEIPGGQFGVKRYKTTYAPKYSIQVMPPLEAEELKSLADRQTASQSIDNGE